MDSRNSWLAELRDLAYEDAGHVRGFLALLMKQRNGEPWSSEDKAQLRRHLKFMGKTLPLVSLLALPGTALFLPILALILDRRAKKRPRSKAFSVPTVPLDTKEP